MQHSPYFRRLLAPLLLLPCLAGCVPNSMQPDETQSLAFAPWTEEEEEYRMGVGDEVEVKLPFHGEFNDRVTIGPDGQATLPLVGSVRFEGRTVGQLTGELNGRFSRDLRDPRVQVAIRAYASARVFVGGEVNNAGVYSLPGRVGLMEVIVMANGFMDTAQTHEVVLIRRGPAGQPMLRTVDAAEFVAGRGSDVRVHPLDIVFVPKTRVAEVNQFVDQFITRVLPFQRSFNYTLGKQNLN